MSRATLAPPLPAAPVALPPIPPAKPPTLPGLPLRVSQAGLRRFSVEEYHRLIDIEVLTEDDNVELLDGYLVRKMARNPPHDNRIGSMMKLFLRVLPPGWEVRPQCAVTLAASEPEPDLAIAAGDETTYETRHPGPSDLALVIEVSASSLATDRADKGPLYAEAGIAEYWIVNLIDGQVEVYGRPTGPASSPEYAARQTYRPGDAVPLPAALGGASIPAADLLP